MPKSAKLRSDDQISFAIDRFLLHQDNDVALKRVQSAREAVTDWKHAKSPRFPEIPFVEELCGGKWVKPSGKTFAHGFSKAGELVFIEWYNAVVYSWIDEVREGVFVNKFGNRYDAHVLRHILMDSKDRTKRVINVVDDQSYSSRYVYSGDRLDSIVTRYFSHTRLRYGKNPKVESVREQTQTFQYAADGTIEASDPAYL